MGFGSVIATAISIIVLLAAGYLLAGSITHSADVTGTSIKAAADLESQRMNTVLAIDEIGSNSAEGWFSFHLENVGQEKITDITQMDVIVKTTGLNQSGTLCPVRDRGSAVGVLGERQHYVDHGRDRGRSEPGHARPWRICQHPRVRGGRLPFQYGMGKGHGAERGIRIIEHHNNVGE